MRVPDPSLESIALCLCCSGNPSGKQSMHRDGGKTSAQETLQQSTTSGILLLPCSSTARGRMGAVEEGTTYQINRAQLHLKT